MSSDDDLQPRFHRGLTLFLAMLVCMSVCLLGSLNSFRRALVFEHPARTTREHFEKGIELEEALRTEPEWLRRTTALFLGRVRPALSEAIDAYAEVVALQARALRTPSTPPGEADKTGDAGKTGDAPTAPGAAGAPGAADVPAAQPGEKEGSAPDESSGAAAGSKAAPEQPGAAEPGAAPGGLGCSPEVFEAPPKDSREELCELLARMAILQGESERGDDVRLTVARLESLGEKTVAHAIATAYHPIEPRTRPPFDAAAVERLAPGWARERLELRLARAAGETERVRSIEEASGARSRALAKRAKLGASLLLAPVLLGLVALLVRLLRDRPALPQSSASIPPAWSFEDGFAVLLRSVVLGLVVIALVGLTAQQLAPALGPLLISLVAPLPMLVMIHRGLLQPRTLPFARVLGLVAFGGPAWKWIGIVFALFAADQLGQALILELCGRIGIGVHWTELVNEHLLRTSSPLFAVLFVLALTWEPLVLETLNRGLVFLTLRQRMPAITASLWSAALIAAFNNASLPYFLVLVWSGFLFAWTFETTRSILPAVAAQILAYAGVYGAIASFYR